MLLKTSLREIRTSLGRYLAIFSIIALGVGFFAGLRVTRAAMLNTADEYLSELHMFDGAPALHPRVDAGGCGRVRGACRCARRGGRLLGGFPARGGEWVGHRAQGVFAHERHQ